jgi:hypothetical protein
MAFTDINSEDRLIQATRPRPRPIVALGTRALVEAKPWQALATASIHPERRLRHPRHRARGQHPRHGARCPNVVSGRPRSAWRRRPVSACAPSARAVAHVVECAGYGQVAPGMKVEVSPASILRGRATSKQNPVVARCRYGRKGSRSAKAHLRPGRRAERFIHPAHPSRRAPSKRLPHKPVRER